MNTDNYLDELISLLLRAQTPDAMAQLLRTLLTDAELQELPKRLQIIRLLGQGMSQREVAKTLGVGIATVTRGAKVNVNIDTIVDSQTS